jgi:hypothetical protein
MSSASLDPDLGWRAAGLHLVGSVPLESSAEVFRAAAGALGPYLGRLPDGETGKRLRWNSWTAPLYARTEGLELISPPEANYTPWRQARLIGDPGELSFPEIGYAGAARESYRPFAALKSEGVIPEHVRFQVCIPSPIAPMIVLVEEGSRAAVEGPFIERLLIEIGEIVDAIPHDQLSIQWDVCQDVGIWEGYYAPYFPDPENAIVGRLARVADAIPADVEVGFHLCYGDFAHQHFLQPKDAGVLCEMSNRLVAAVERRIEWIHVPVPRDRSDLAYFEPFAGLALGPETDFYLGLIHLTDGLEGTKRRIEAARQVVPEFGVGTECGFGRRPPETVHELLRLHAEVAALTW